MRVMRTSHLQGFLGAPTILVLVGVAIILAGQRVRADSRSVAHTFEVIGQLDRVEANLLEGIGAQRSYLLTGDPSYREVYDTSRVRLDDELAALMDLVTDNPQQTVRAPDINARIKRRLDAAQDGIRIF